MYGLARLGKTTLSAERGRTLLAERRRRLSPERSGGLLLLLTEGIRRQRSPLLHHRSLVAGQRTDGLVVGTGAKRVLRGVGVELGVERLESGLITTSVVGGGTTSRGVSEEGLEGGVHLRASTVVGDDPRHVVELLVHVVGETSAETLLAGGLVCAQLSAGESGGVEAGHIQILDDALARSVLGVHLAELVGNGVLLLGSHLLGRLVALVHDVVGGQMLALLVAHGISKVDHVDDAVVVDEVLGGRAAVGLLAAGRQLEDQLARHDVGLGGGGLGVGELLADQAEECRIVPALTVDRVLGNVLVEESGSDQMTRSGHNARVGVGDVGCALGAGLQEGIANVGESSHHADLGVEDEDAPLVVRLLLALLVGAVGGDVVEESVGALQGVLARLLGARADADELALSVALRGVMDCPVESRVDRAIEVGERRVLGQLCSLAAEVVVGHLLSDEVVDFLGAGEKYLSRFWDGKKCSHWAMRSFLVPSFYIFHIQNYFLEYKRWGANMIPPCITLSL